MTLAQTLWCYETELKSFEIKPFASTTVFYSKLLFSSDMFVESYCTLDIRSLAISRAIFNLQRLSSPLNRSQTRVTLIYDAQSQIKSFSAMFWSEKLKFNGDKN